MWCLLTKPHSGHSRLGGGGGEGGKCVGEMNGVLKVKLGLG